MERMEETAFPRGKRKSSFTLKEGDGKKKKKRVKHENKKDDFLFGQHEHEHDESTVFRKKSMMKEKSSSKVHTTSMMPMGGGCVVPSTQKKQAVIESIGFSKLAKNTKLLAMVKQVFDDYAILSLPNMLSGYILKDKHPLTDVLKANQMLAVKIVKTATENVKDAKGTSVPRRRIQVSALPSSINAISIPDSGVVRGQIVSVEDHGCLVDLGGPNRGFLKYEDIHQGYKILDNNDAKDDTPSTAKDTLCVNAGRVMDLMVKQDVGVTSKIIPLTLPTHDTMASYTSRLAGPVTLSTLFPGTCVYANIEAMARNGLLVNFWNGLFRGAIEMSHIGATWIPSSKNKDDEDWKSVFGTQKQQGKIKRVLARIVCVDSTLKVIRLAMLPHVMNLSTPPPMSPVGTVVEKATVVRLDHGVGALLALPPPTDNDNSNGATVTGPLAQVESYVEASKIRTVYVHISKAVDGKERISESDFAKQFAPSSKHTCRILNTNHVLEGIATGATATSIVEAHVLTHGDLEPGKVYRNVPVHAHLEKSNSILIDFGMGVIGLIPSQHLFDTSTSSSESYRSKLIKTKYSVGSKVTVRVLTVDIETKRCIVTAKKSLVTNKQAPVTTYESLEKGQVATGFISSIEEKALFVTFYNNVYGRVTLKRLVAEMGIQDLRENFRAGDVVTCRVVECSSANKDMPEGDKYWRLDLSLKLDGPIEETLQDEKDGPGTRLKPGTILPAKSLKIVDLVDCQSRLDGNGYIPGYAIVNIKAKHFENNDETPGDSFVECKLPFDQLFDSYSEEEVSSADSLNALAHKLLVVGKKINQRGLVVLHSRKPRPDGKVPLPILSLRPKWIESAEGNVEKSSILLPSRETNLVLGQYVRGFVTRVDERYGAFVRFLDNLTGLIPKVKKGLEMDLYSTVTCKIIALDTTQRPVKILLRKSSSPRQKKEKGSIILPRVKAGDLVGDVVVKNVGFARSNVELLGEKFSGLPSGFVKARIHFTMAESASLPLPVPKKTKRKGNVEGKKSSPWRVTKHHPFFKWKAGMRLSDLRCAQVETRGGVLYLELTNRHLSNNTEPQEARVEQDNTALIVKKADDLLPGQQVSGIVTYIPRNNLGLFVQVCPGITGYVPAMELSTHAGVLNNLRSYFPIGARIDCSVIKKTSKDKVAASDHGMDDGSKKQDRDVAFLSVLYRVKSRQDGSFDKTFRTPKPAVGDLVIGRVNKSIAMVNGPALMMDLRGGHVARCCVTELNEVDEWMNMPLGRMEQHKPNVKKNAKAQPQIGKEKQNVVSDEDDGHEIDDSMDSDEDESDRAEANVGQEGEYPRGKYVQCRVLTSVQSSHYVDVSLRPSRIEGDLDDDQIPEVSEMAQAYVVDTNKKGCFVRLSRQVEGKVMLKEIADGFIPDPATVFPMGRLVAGKIKAVHERKKQGSKKKDKHTGNVKALVDMDMRESTLLESNDRLQLADIKVGGKHKGVVTRIETYGVFVRLDNSNVSGLVHKSECSDDYVKNLTDLYDPGDLVKVLVIKADLELKRIGLSMKASHFEDDEDSDDSSMEDVDEDLDSVHSDEDMDDAVVSDSDEWDSDDENYASKLASKLALQEDSDSDAGNSDSEDESSAEDSDDDDIDEGANGSEMMDTDVGFHWDAGVASEIKDMDAESDHDDSSSDESSDDEEEQDEAKKHRKSKKRAAARRREEQEISRRETALADGTANDNPETAGDFERLLASEPNQSEHWIRYMAFHLSLADVQKARAVAERAFDRIEFRQESEKLNVWTALLTLELKYGSWTSLQETVDRACQHNNPKQVYLRVCEMLERDIDGATTSTSSQDAVARADEMFAKMCKKFKGKKTVWISHLKYLLKSNRPNEAHALLKRSLMSLPEYKHVETMSKFAQMEFEYGSAERGRTIFKGLLEKYPKRLDLLFVLVDKEVKNDEVESARALLEEVANSSDRQFSDKQMKSLFKKWYRIEEEHGSDASREHVKNEARSFVDRTSKG